MSRSNHNGCGKSCGLCRPHKKWKSNSPEDQRPNVQRKLQEVDGDLSPDELAAEPDTCHKDCCMPAAVLDAADTQTFICKKCGRTWGDFFYCPTEDCCAPCAGVEFPP